MIDIYGRERCEVFAEYLIDNGATVRGTAQHFGISKSTVHKDLTVKLRYINKRLFQDVWVQKSSTKRGLCKTKSQ